MRNELIPVMGFATGSADIGTLRKAMVKALDELMSDDAEVAEMSKALSIPPDVLRSCAGDLFSLKPGKAGLLSQGIAVILGVVTSKIIESALIELAKEELKEKLRPIIKKKLIPRLKHFLNNGDSLGQPRDLK